MWLKDTYDFYPTPENVINDVLQSVNIVGQTILEPSAGSGNFVKYLKKNGAKEVIACEIDSRLRAIVEKECRILKDDFLQVESHEISHVDLIIMNPPFSKQEDHILHAWDIAPAGCQIVSICNSSLVKNPFSKDRLKICEIMNFHGTSERLGDVFGNSERRTGVDCSVVYLFKPAGENDDFSEYFDLNEEYERSDIEGVIRYDYIRDLVNRYVGAIKLYDDVLSNAVQMNSIVGPFSDGKLTFTCTIKETPTEKETFRKELQKRMWDHIFKKMNMHKYVTQGVKEDINKFVEQQTHVPFTMKNIYKMLEVIVGTHGSRMNKVLVEAFEKICSFSYENSTAGEKWKTNSDYMINRRFIVPYITEGDFYGTKRTHVHLTYKGYDFMNDIIKALCHLTGQNYDQIQPLYDRVHSDSLIWGQWYEWAFFRIRGYKKGTMHFEFIDEDIWMKFNRRVAEIKGWRLPATQRSKAKTSKPQEVALFQ